MLSLLPTTGAFLGPPPWLLLCTTAPSPPMWQSVIWDDGQAQVIERNQTLHRRQNLRWLQAGTSCSDTKPVAMLGESLTPVVLLLA